MAEWVRSLLDLVLICMVGAGLVQAVRLIRSLADLRAGRVEMERFVYEFSATVLRAEAGIKGLRQAARDSGDDLEKLVEKADLLRDELQLIVGSAEQIAERLSIAASGAARPDFKPQEAKMGPEVRSETPAAPAVAQFTPRKVEPVAAQPSSRAEKELLQALQKLN